LVPLRRFVDEAAAGFAADLIKGILIVMKVDSWTPRNYIAIGPLYRFGSAPKKKG
jgi:hypothetical protein